MELRKERYRKVRGLILKILACQHPGGLDLKILHYSLDNIGYTITGDELRSHLEYLEQKTPPLLKLENRKTGRIMIEMVVITSAGLDVLDAFTDDCGIDVRF